MKIDSNKLYKVKKYTAKTSSDCGVLSGEDVNNILKGYEYDDLLDMWFSKKANIGYSVEEC